MHLRVNPALEDIRQVHNRAGVATVHKTEHMDPVYERR